MDYASLVPDAAQPGFGALAAFASDLRGLLSDPVFVAGRKTVPTKDLFDALKAAGKLPLFIGSSWDVTPAAVGEGEAARTVSEEKFDRWAREALARNP